MNQLTKAELRNIQIDILIRVAKYCDEQKLRYYLAYGTLLGAVRHKGYIPWDDDIDILMPRPDYDIFINEFNNDNSEYKVYTFMNEPNYPWPYAKVSYEKTIYIEKLAVYFDKIGVNIDVFPMDGLPSTHPKRKKIVDLLMIRRKLLNIKHISLSSQRPLYKNAILMFGKILVSGLNYKTLIKLIDQKAKSFEYDEGEYVGCLVWNYGHKEIMSRRVFSNKCKLEFEGKEFYAPKMYDEFLINIYGDYMKLPSKEKRITHHDFNAYWK